VRAPHCRRTAVVAPPISTPTPRAPLVLIPTQQHTKQSSPFLLAAVRKAHHRSAPRAPLQRRCAKELRAAALGCLRLPQRACFTLSRCRTHRWSGARFLAVCPAARAPPWGQLTLATLRLCRCCHKGHPDVLILPDSRVDRRTGPFIAIPLRRPTSEHLLANSSSPAPNHPDWTSTSTTPSV
jgi:hypothetical protein